MTENTHRFIEQCLNCEGSAAHEDVMWETLPVPFFGNILGQQIEVATVALNPSVTEFETLSGERKNPKARLPMWIDFNRVKRGRCEMTGVHAQQAETARLKYFVPSADRAPHCWFDALQETMTAMRRHWSYANGTAVHLDLVACATKPVWSKLKGGDAARKDLIRNCFPHFVNTLSKLRPEVLLIFDGKTAFETMQSRKCFFKIREASISGDMPLTIWRGRLSRDYKHRKFIGWNIPINKQRKMYFRSHSPAEWRVFLERQFHL